MDEIEPLQRISGDEPAPTIGAITAAGDFHSANKRGRADLDQRKRNGQKTTFTPTPDDVVVLSAVAQAILLEEEGMSISAIAAGLGLSTEAVLTDLGIAAQICHPPGSASPLGHGGAASAAR